MLPRYWKKLFNSGVVIQAKMRFCNKCKDKTLCDECNNQVNENKDFEAILNLLKRQAANEFGHICPYFKD